jgi:hypothetical protein
MATVSIVASKDNSLYDAYPRSNYGLWQNLYLNNKNFCRPVLEFLLSTLPAGATINSATLGLYISVLGFGVSGQSIDACKLTRTNWIEGVGTGSASISSSNWLTYDEALAIGTIENGTGTLVTNPTSLRSAYTGSVTNGVRIATGGTFTVTLNPGVTGVATSNAWSVTDDPKALVSGVNVIEVTGSGGGGIDIYLYPDLAWTVPGGDYVEVAPAKASAIMPAALNWITWDITDIVKDAQLLSIPVELLVKYQDGKIENLTGTLHTNPTTLVVHDNWPVIDAAGTFTVTLPTGVTGIAQTDGWVVTDSPKALVSGVNVIEVQAGGSGTITLVCEGPLGELQADAYMPARDSVTPALRPYLLIDYTPSGPTPSGPGLSVDILGILDCIGWKWR